QAQWLEFDHRGPLHTLFVGADSIVLQDPLPKLPSADLCLTLRPGHDRYPINNGFQFIPHKSRAKVAPIYREIASLCGPKWCDDQRAIQTVLAPMPLFYGKTERKGIDVHFLPMRPFNVVPKSAADPSSGSVLLHFRGKGRKTLFFDWAAKHMAA